MVQIDIQIPESCTECMFYLGLYGGTCVIKASIDSGQLNTSWTSFERDPGCPLIEVNSDD